MSSTEFSISHSNLGVLLEKHKGTYARFRWTRSWDFIMGTICYTVTYTGYNTYGVESNPGVIQYMLVGIFVGLPIFYTHIFLGQYCQMGMLNFRHIMPMARGIMYTFLVCVLMKTIRFGCALTDTILYLLMSFQRNLPWSRCPKGYEDVCSGNNSSAGYPHTAYVFWRYIYSGNPTLDMQKISYSMPSFIMVTCFSIQWVFMFIVAVAAYWNHLKLTKTLFYIHFSILSILMVALAFKAESGVSPYTLIFSQTSELFQLEPWLLAIRTVLVNFCLADLYNMYSGAHLPKGALSGTLSFCCVCAISVLNLMASSLSYICYSIINKQYPSGISVKHPHELSAGVAHILIIIPQAISTLTVPQLWSSLFFISCICLIVSNQMLHLFSIQMTITDMYPNFAKYRTYLLAGCCLFGCVAGILLQSKTIYVAAKYAIENAMDNLVVICNLIWTVTIYWVYGVSTLSDDIQFLMGTQPTKFWKITWYLVPSILVLTIIAYFSLHATMHQNYIFINVCMLMMLVTPFAFFFVSELFVSIKRKNLLGTFQAHRKWGPPDLEDRIYRKFFNPSTETKYQAHKLICHHNCLLSSPVLRNVVHQENALRDNYFNVSSKTEVMDGYETQSSIVGSTSM
nr:creatine transporter-like [Onthophagus taurus]